MENEGTEKESFWLTVHGFLCFSIIILVLWILYWLAVWWVYPELTQRGQSGDAFGGLNALFSGFAFAGLIFTLLIQKQELKYQRDELRRLVDEQELTRGHLEGQEEQLRKQSEFIERQIFENSFFQMLSSFSGYVNTIQIAEKTGSDALEDINRRLNTHRVEIEKDFDAGYDAFFKKHKNDLAPNFRQIYNILKFIDNSTVDNKKFYTNILRAQLNDAELRLLAFNGASPYGSEKMAPLMKEFQFLKHLSDKIGSHLYPQRLRKFYADWDIPALSNK